MHTLSSNDPNLIIKELICQNRGTQSFATKQDMIDAAKERGIIISNDMKKDQIYDILITVYTLNELEQMYRVGLTSYHIQQKFNISNYQVKKLANSGAIRITGKEEFRAYGAYHIAPLYSVFDYCRLSPEEVHEWLEVHKGKRKENA